LSQGRAPLTAVILEPKSSEPGSTSEKGESYEYVRRVDRNRNIMIAVAVVVVIIAVIVYLYAGGHLSGIV
jgi:hypothetical protein